MFPPEFFSIYASELRNGKFWGVAHDLHALGVELPGGMPWVGPYTARFDRVFYSTVRVPPIDLCRGLDGCCTSFWRCGLVLVRGAAVLFYYLFFFSLFRFLCFLILSLLI